MKKSEHTPIEKERKVSQGLMSDIERIIVGLGNPGSKYSWTRHNIGAHIVKALAAAHNIDMQPMPWAKANGATIDVCGKKTLLMTPTTYMNISGESVFNVMKKTKLSLHSLLVIFDDLETPFGAFKIVCNGGSRGHNGIRSIHECLKEKSFFQLRFGIGRPDHSDIADYVLSRFNDSERDQLSTRIPLCIDEISAWISK